VIRSGYGIFYDNANMPGYDGGIQQDGYNAFAVFASSMGGLQAAFLLSDGLPSNHPVPPNLDSTFDNGGLLRSTARAMPTGFPMRQQWNLTLEHQFSGNNYLSASYVGTKGTRLLSQIAPINALNPSYLSLGAQLYDVFQPGQTELDGVPAPFSGFATVVTGCAPSVRRHCCPFRSIATPSEPKRKSGNSIYHALQVKAEHTRFAKGLWALLSLHQFEVDYQLRCHENIYGQRLFHPSRSSAIDRSRSKMFRRL